MIYFITRILPDTLKVIAPFSRTSLYGTIIKVFWYSRKQVIALMCESVFLHELCVLRIFHRTMNWNFLAKFPAKKNDRNCGFLWIREILLVRCMWSIKCVFNALRNMIAYPCDRVIIKTLSRCIVASAFLRKDTRFVYIKI